MRAAMVAYLGAGGRLMYLGGNGYYWVTGVDAERPHVIEVRKGIAGTRAWNSEPGELHMSTTGELGGLWRHRGKPPNEIAGNGFKAMGWHAPTPGFKRQPGSFDQRAAFIFEGIGPDETIGDFGLSIGGAAGDELDRIDFALGSPPHTLLALGMWAIVLGALILILKEQNLGPAKQLPDRYLYVYASGVLVVMAAVFLKRMTQLRMLANLRLKALISWISAVNQPAPGLRRSQKPRNFAALFR